MSLSSSTMSTPSPVPIPAPRRVRTLRQVRDAEDGPPFTVAELAQLTTLAQSTVLRDIRLGYLASTKREGPNGLHLIAFEEGKRWLGRLGLLGGREE